MEENNNQDDFNMASDNTKTSDNTHEDITNLSTFDEVTNLFKSINVKNKEELIEEKMKDRDPQKNLNSNIDKLSSEIQNLHIRKQKDKRNEEFSKRRNLNKAKLEVLIGINAKLSINIETYNKIQKSVNKFENYETYFKLLKEDNPEIKYEAIFNIRRLLCNGTY